MFWHSTSFGGIHPNAGSHIPDWEQSTSYWQSAVTGDSTMNKIQFTRTRAILLALAISCSACIAAKPIRVLLISGGCFHDYYCTQTKILTDSLNKYISNIDWNIVIGNGTTNDVLPVLAAQNWGKGYDLVIYNMCWADVTDTSYINNICRNHQDGLNAIVLHCTMHTFRDSKDEEWKKLLGVDTHEHQQPRVFNVVKVNADHPVMKDFPAQWTTPVEEELYIIKREFPTTTPLAKGIDAEGREFTCFWTNTYGKSRIVGSTVGHNTETFQDHNYIMFLARSVLWLSNNINDKGEPNPEYWKLASVPKEAKFHKHDVRIIDNFEDYRTNADLSKVWQRPNWGCDMTPGLSAEVKQAGTNGLECKYKTTGELSKKFAVVMRNGRLDLSGYNALQFWMKPDGSGRQLDVQLNISNTNGENVGDYWEVNYKTDRGDTASRVVTLPFSKFKQPASADLSNKNIILDVSKILQLAFTVRAAEGQTGEGVFYFDNIQAVTEIQLPVVMENFNHYSTDSEISEAWHAPGHGGPVKRSIGPDIQGGGGSSLKCEYTTTDSKDKFYAPFCRVDQWDLSGCDAVQFWFKPDGSGRELLFELNIPNGKGNNIHDLWDYSVIPQKGDTAARLITVPFSKLVHNTKFADSNDWSPVFLPGAVIEVSFCIGGHKSEPGNGVCYIGEIEGVKLKE